jgi:hypothetical protein
MAEAKAKAATEAALGFFSTPGDLKAAADSFDAQLLNIDNAIDGNMEIPQALWDGFQAFRSQWKGFYHENFSSLWDTRGAWLTSDLESKLVQFIGQGETFGEQVQAYGITIPGGLIAPPAPLSLDPLKGLGITFDVALLIVLAIVIVWKVWK